MKNKSLIFSIVILLHSFVWAQGFTTNNTNGNLLDACGNNFIMKGMNVPTAWFVSNVNGSIASLKTNTKSNCLRIVVTTSTADNAWQTSVVNCINNKMIPMVELHDATGSTDPARLKAMGDFWATKASFFNNTNFNGVNIKKHILVNLANEWGTWQTATNKNTAWRDAVINAIKPMRNAGITTTIVVDAVGYGQDIDDAYNIRTYAKDIQRADNTNLGGPANSTEKSNLLFSIHMYCEWRKEGDNIGIVNTIKNSGIPIIVGEFGYQHASDGSCDIDEQGIMNTCQTGGIGWLAWSQKGNGSPVEYLDLCIDWACTSLSAWGNTIINGTNGTKTAVECSVFSNASCNPITCNTPAPTVIATRSFCQNSVATALTATGTSLKWYSVATGGTAASASPIPTTTNLGSTTYYVSQTVSNCEGPRSSIVVTVISNPVVNITSPINNATLISNSVVINAGVTGAGISNVQFYNGTSLLNTDYTAPYSYNWANVANGNYTLNVKATDANNCTNTATTKVTLSTVTKLNESETIDEVSCFPNPFAQSFTIKAPEKFDYFIFDLKGIEVGRGAGENTVSVGQNLPVGLYTVKIQNDSKVSLIKINKF
jgi:Cellulase (glycosyl hydrolase family 5)/Bacterial Ig domain/Ig-like domain CHU_C associated